MERLTIKERMESSRNLYIAKCRKEVIKMGRPDTYKKCDESYKERVARQGCAPQGLTGKNRCASLKDRGLRTILHTE